MNAFRNVGLRFSIVPGVLVLSLGLVACGGGEKPGEAPAGKKAEASAPKIPDPLTIFKAQITPVNVPATVKAGSEFVAEVKARNLGDSPWPHKGGKEGENSVHFCYHWLDADGKMVQYDGKRTELSKDVAPTEEIPVKVGIIAPEKPGEYIIEFDLVQERVSWFKDRGSKTATATIKVE